MASTPMAFPEKDKDRIKRAIIEKLSSVPLCPVCGLAEWVVGEGLHLDPVSSEHVVASVVIVCSHCGHTEFVNAVALGLDRLLRARTPEADTEPAAQRPPESRITEATPGRVLLMAALDHYGEPTQSLRELRAAVTRALPNSPLSELIIRERAEGA